MEDLIKQFFELCKRWREFSREAYGWQIREYGEVRCYFADSGEHTSVTIEDISVGFFSSPDIEGKISKLTEKNLSRLIDEYSAKLDSLKHEFESRSETEKNEEKQRLIDGLKKRLTELENL